MAETSRGKLTLSCHDPLHLNIPLRFGIPLSPLGPYYFLYFMKSSVGDCLSVISAFRSDLGGLPLCKCEISSFGSPVKADRVS